jgi:hypothetical protein
MEWHHLKCRAETLYDVCQFIVWVNKRNYNYEDIDIRLVYSRIEPLGSSECTWEFESNLEPWDIRRLMREAEREDNSDFHIMRQTLQYMETYDGERWYSETENEEDEEEEENEWEEEETQVNNNESNQEEPEPLQ